MYGLPRGTGKATRPDCCPSPQTSAVTNRVFRLPFQGSRVVALTAMKILSAGNVSLMSVVLAGIKVADAARETLTVSEGGVTFTAIRFDDGRNKPFRLKFHQDGIPSLHLFNPAGFVTNVKVDTEQYEVRRLAPHQGAMFVLLYRVP